MIYHLPFDTYIEVAGISADPSVNYGGSIRSNLKSELPGKGGDVMESFLLALACEGVDLHDPRFARALNTVLEAYSNHD